MSARNCHSSPVRHVMASRYEFFVDEAGPGHRYDMITASHRAMTTCLAPAPASWVLPGPRSSCNEHLGLGELRIYSSLLIRITYARMLRLIWLHCH